MNFEEMSENEILDIANPIFDFNEALEWLPKEENWSAKTQVWKFRVLASGIVQTMRRAFIVKAQNALGTYSYRTSSWRLESGV